LKKPYEVDIDAIEKYDLIGFGSGIYFLKHHKNLLEFIDKLPSTKKKAFIFSTKGVTPNFINHMLLKKKLKRKGFEIIGEFSCKGYDSFGILKYIGGINKGRPNKKDLKRAREFAERMHDVISF